jgi:hypothetical protein
MAKVSTKREAVVTASDRVPRGVTQRRTIADTEIARRAYDLYLARGCEPGHDVEDWLQAQRERKGSASAE